MFPVLLWLLASMMLLSCDSMGDQQAPSRDLAIQWCPSSGEVTWTFDFGDADGDLEPQTWTGDYQYSMTGTGSGAGGARSSSSCSHGADREIGPLEHPARWRLSGTVELGSRPETLSVTIEEGPEKMWRAASGPIQARFEISDPPLYQGDDCVSLDARLVNESAD